MTENLHITPEMKRKIDEIMPTSIDNEKVKVSYDDFIGALMFFLITTLGYEKHDIMQLVIEYKKNQLEVLDIANQ